MFRALKYETEFAVKVISFEGKIEAFEHSKLETAAIKYLYHENVIKIYDEFYSSEYGGIAMEYCPNGSLEDYIKLKGSLSSEEIGIISQSIISAVYYCHSKKMDSYFHPQLTDFGIAMRLGPKLFPFTHLEMDEYRRHINHGTFARSNE